jgi:hypothetical protein
MAVLVETAVEAECALRPEPFQHLNELLAAGVALVVVEPLLAEAGVLVFEPARDDVEREPAVADAVGSGDEVRHRTGLPEAGVDGAD